MEEEEVWPMGVAGDEDEDEEEEDPSCSSSESDAGKDKKNEKGCEYHGVDNAFKKKG